MSDRRQPLSPSGPETRPERLPVLDGIRGCAILMVLIWHYGHCLVIGTANLPPDHLAWRILSFCGIFWSGVDMFFVLSGFLIGGILLENRRAPNYFQVFYVRRLLRIFPVYYLTLALFYLARSVKWPAAYGFLFESPLPLWSYLTLTQNLAMTWHGHYGPTWLDATWSLAVEEQFYLLIPFIVWYFSRRTLYGVLWVTILGAPLLRMAWPGITSFVGLPFRADALMLGVLLACALRSPVVREFCRQQRPAIQGAWLVLLAGLWVMTRGTPNFGSLGLSWLAVCYAGMILIGLCSPDSWLAGLLCNRLLVWLGRRSYGIYLGHQPIIGLVFASLAGKAPGISSGRDAGLMLLSLGSTLVLAEMSFRWFEKPILSFGRSFVYRQAPSGDGLEVGASSVALMPAGASAQTPPPA